MSRNMAVDRERATPASTSSPRKQRGLFASIASYPRAVFFMLGNEFCERFSFYGMRSVLTLYLILENGFQDSNASLLYHSFIALAYFSALFGSVAADNFFGRFRVILWVSLVYVLGQFVLAFGAVPQFAMTFRLTLGFLGLFLVAMATGGIKPCVSAFAADQFGDEMRRERTQFFSFFYFAINAGSIFAMFLTPILRGRVHCLGSQHCFPLAFGVPGVLMLAAFLIFLAGIPHYKRTPVASDNILGRVIGCIWHAASAQLRHIILFRRGTRSMHQKPAHWLDYSTARYGAEMVRDARQVLRILVLLCPVVLFWALFDQQGSTWVLQARKMDGRIGSLTIFPDQMMTLNPLIVLLMVPIFEGFVYPAIAARVRLTPLRKMGAGGLFAASSFIAAGILQLWVSASTDPAPAPGSAFLWRIGPSQVPVHFFADGNGRDLMPGQRVEVPRNASILVDNRKKIAFDDGKMNGACGHVLALFGPITANKTEATSKNNSISVAPKSEEGVEFELFPYSCKQPENSRTRLILVVDKRTSMELLSTDFSVLDAANNIVSSGFLQPIGVTVLELQPPFVSRSRDYVLVYGSPACAASSTSNASFFSSKNSTTIIPNRNCQQIKFTAGSGAILGFLLSVEEGNGGGEHTEVVELVKPHQISIGWQFPQFFLVTIGEVLLSVSGLEFSYSQAPLAMKSIMQAAWLLTTFFGDLIDMAISGAHLIDDPAIEFFIYSALCATVTFVFIALATRYRYSGSKGDEDSDDEEEES